MHEFEEFLMPFAAGVAIGSGTVFALVKSRLTFYRHMIERRLDVINQRIVSP